MRKLVVLLAFLGGCLCDGDRVEDAVYVPTRAEPRRLAACLEGQDCQPLCKRAFGLDDGVRIARCEVVEKRYDPQAVPMPAHPMAGLLGATLEVTYYLQVPCEGDDGWVDDGSDDGGGYDDGGYDDEDDGGYDPCDDGSCDDPGDDGGGDDPGDDGGGDDPGGDDGGGDDGGGDDGGGEGLHAAHLGPRA